MNHLLARESWARERFKPYAGKTARLSCAPFALSLVVQPDGLIAAIDEAEARHFDVTISVPLDALPAFLQGGQAAVMKHVRIEGDAEFATTIAKLAEHLRWEPEEDLARVIGDAPAHRIGVDRAHGAANRRGARAAICLNRSPNTCSTNNRNSCAAARSTRSTPNCRTPAMRSRASKSASSELEQKAEARGASASGAAAIPRGTRK